MAWSLVRKQFLKRHRKGLGYPGHYFQAWISFPALDPTHIGQINFGRERQFFLRQLLLNGGYRRPVEAAILSGMGVQTGAADLLLWHDGKALPLELKAPGGRPSKAQLAFLADMEAAGAFTPCAEGLDRALWTLEAWGLLRGRAA